jgi:uncharacterized protein (DUF488 family)
MERFGKEFQKRRASNAAALEAAFGIALDSSPNFSPTPRYRTIRQGSATTIFTIGYEKRDIDGLISLLHDAGIDLLADIRQRPVSRVACFREGPLSRYCENAGIEYRNWPTLGSTDELRDKLKATGDFKRFEGRFRKHVAKVGRAALEELAAEAGKKSTALLCYERLHEECHRSAVAEMLADILDATIVAL